MITIEENKGLSEDKINILLQKYEYGRYSEDKTLISKQSKLYLKDILIDYIKVEGNEYFFALNEKDEPIGILFFRKSKWDTDHFGYNVAVIDYLITLQEDNTYVQSIASKLLSFFDKWAIENKIRFVTVKIPSQDLGVLHAVESKHFNYIENWIYNHYDLRNFQADDNDRLLIRYAKEEDKEFMIKYSKGAFSSHRFHADRRIDSEKADSLYEKWIITAFADTNQKIAVYDHKGIPTAFMIYYESNLTKYFDCTFAMWKMGLVNPEMGHQGIGNRFVKSLFKFHKDENLDIIDSGLSIRNIPSLNWHNKLNFKITSTLVTFHKWYY